MKKYILLVLLPLLLLSMESKGQDSLIISPYSVVIGNDTVSNGAVDSISFWVVNISATPFSDSIALYTSVQDSAFAFIYYPIDSVFMGTTTIAPNDSAPVTLYISYDVNPVRFHYDINVIVIWPLTAASSSIDSLYYVEFISLPNGIDEIDLSKLIKAYPNPTINNLTIENTSEKVIEEVRIYEAGGRLIQIEKNSSFIYTDKWKAGTYLIKIQLENKQTRTIRVIKR